MMEEYHAASLEQHKSRKKFQCEKCSITFTNEREMREPNIDPILNPIIEPNIEPNIELN